MSGDSIWIGRSRAGSAVCCGRAGGGLEIEVQREHPPAVVADTQSAIVVPEPEILRPKISVVGVGGAGSNAVNNMIVHGLEGVEFVVCNTDAQALEQSLAPTRVQLGASVTSGLGAGAKPEVGRKAAIDSTSQMLDLLADSHMCFVTAGLGGGTGTGAGARSGIGAGAGAGSGAGEKVGVRHWRGKWHWRKCDLQHWRWRWYWALASV